MEVEKSALREALDQLIAAQLVQTMWSYLILEALQHWTCGPDKELFKYDQKQLRPELVSDGFVIWAATEDGQPIGLGLEKKMGCLFIRARDPMGRYGTQWVTPPVEAWEAYEEMVNTLLAA